MKYSPQQIQEIEDNLDKNSSSFINTTKLVNIIHACNKALPEPLDIVTWKGDLESLKTLDTDKEIIDILIYKTKTGFRNRQAEGDWHAYGLFTYSLMQYLKDNILPSAIERAAVVNYLYPYLDVNKSNYLTVCKLADNLKQKFWLPQGKRNRTFITYRDLVFFAYLTLRSNQANFRNIKRNLPSYMHHLFMKNNEYKNISLRKLEIDPEILNKFEQISNNAIDDNKVKRKKPGISTIEKYFSESKKSNGSFFSFNDSKAEKIEKVEVDITVNLLLDEFSSILTNDLKKLLLSIKKDPSKIFP